MLREQTAADREAQRIEEEMEAAIEGGHDHRLELIRLEETYAQDHPCLGHDDTHDLPWAVQGHLQ